MEIKPQSFTKLLTLFSILVFATFVPFSPIFAQTLPPPSLQEPGNSQKINTLTPQLKWQSSNQAQQYQIQIDDESTFASPVINTSVQAFPDTRFGTRKLRVIEVRYFPRGSSYIYHPDTLSSELQQLIKDASSFQKYKNPSALPGTVV